MQRLTLSLTVSNIALFFGSVLRRFPLDLCGPTSGLLDLTGIGYWGVYSVIRQTVDVIMLVNRLLLVAAWIVQSLRDFMLRIMAGDGTLTNPGLIGHLFFIFGPIFAAAASFALILYGLFTITRFISTYNVTSPQRIIWVTLAALYLFGSGGTVARAFDTLRDQISTSAFIWAYKGVQAAGISLPGASDPVPLSCDLDTNSNNFCSGLTMALNYLYFNSTGEITDDQLPQAFRDRYYSVPSSMVNPLAGINSGELLPGTVHSLTCQQAEVGDALIANATGGVVRALEGIPVSQMAVMEELIGLMFSLMTMIVFIGLGFTLVLAVFSAFAEPLNQALRAAIETIRAAIIANLLLGAMTGLVLLMRDNLLFFSAAKLIAGIVSTKVFFATLNMLFANFNVMTSSIGGVAHELRINRLSEPTSSHSRSRSLDQVASGAIAGASFGANYGERGVYLGAAAGAAATMAGLGQSARQLALFSGLRRSSLRNMPGGEEPESEDRVPDVAPRSGLGDLQRSNMVEDMLNRDQGATTTNAPVPAASSASPAAQPVTRVIQQSGGSQPPTNVPTNATGAPPTSGPAKPTPLSRPANVSRPGTDWSSGLAQAYQAQSGNAWTDAYKAGYSGQVNLLVRVAKDNGLPPERVAEVLRQAGQGEAGQNAALKTVMSSAPNMSEVDAQHYVQLATPLAKWVSRADGKSPAPAVAA